MMAKDYKTYLEQNRFLNKQSIFKISPDTRLEVIKSFHKDYNVFSILKKELIWIESQLRLIFRGEKNPKEFIFYL